jgi:hypothetical protein
LRKIEGQEGSDNQSDVFPKQATGTSRHVNGNVEDSGLPMFDFAAMGSGAELGLGFSDGDDLFSLFMGDQVVSAGPVEAWNVKDE